MDRTRTLILLVASATFVAACGGDDSTSDTADTASGSEAGAIVAVSAGESDLGPVLVGPDGNTLYGFTIDTPTQSNCDGDCAQAWPPLIVPADWTVDDGVDAALFDTITRPDGSLQVVAGEWPLYAFSGDSVPGDVNGQGSGDMWFAVGTDGTLLEEAAAPSGGLYGP